MKYRPVILISTAVLISLTVVAILYARSDKKVNHRYASFERNLVPAALKFQKDFELPYNNAYFAGYADGYIWIGHHHAPGQMRAVNTALSAAAEIIFKVADDSLRYKAIQVRVDSPYFYFIDGNMPFVYRGDFNQRTKATLLSNDQYFTTAIPVSGNAIAMVFIDSSHESTLARKTMNESALHTYPDLLEEQGDGIFSTDGRLLYDKESGKLVYVYLYRNQFICMDTSLTLLYRGKTIDTVSKAKIKTGKITSDNAVTFTAPPLVVNKLSCASGNRLYVNSNLLAKNENPEEFDKNNVVDVYELTGGTYRYSFYIPPSGKQKLQGFTVINRNLLVCFYDKKLAAYRLEPPEEDRNTLSEYKILLQ